ncbi:hypothetical protein HID58_066576 [Brassica napus]|uniref:Uncharacterized protein n=1 Tax=Brassica napus TaxID=3708 RepID=A0ABQ7ZG13_BRANA|nr:hypothetical protein HID58_066576 [Brassica napus]
MRGAHGDDMLFVNEKVPSQLSSNDSVAYNACSPHHNSLNKPVAKILFPEIKTSKLKGAYSLLVKIFARAGDFQNQVQPLEEALNRMSMRVVEYEKFCGGEAAGSSSTTSKYGGVKELKSVTLQELNSCVLNSTPHVRPLNKVYF